MSDKLAASPEGLNSWLEKGMRLSPEELKKHLCQIPPGVKPLKALQGLGIVFSGGYTKKFDCVGYPQTSGLPKDRGRFDCVLTKVKEYEKAGEYLKVGGFALSEKLISNFANNK